MPQPKPLKLCHPWRTERTKTHSLHAARADRIGRLHATHHIRSRMRLMRFWWCCEWFCVRFVTRSPGRMCVRVCCLPVCRAVQATGHLNGNAWVPFTGGECKFAFTWSITYRKVFRLFSVLFLENSFVTICEAMSCMGSLSFYRTHVNRATFPWAEKNSAFPSVCICQVDWNFITQSFTAGEIYSSYAISFPFAALFMFVISVGFFVFLDRLLAHKHKLQHMKSQTHITLKKETAKTALGASKFVRASIKRFHCSKEHTYFFHWLARYK